MKLKKFLIFALTALLAITTLATVQANAKSKYVEYEYKYKTDSAYTISEMKKSKDYTIADESSNPKYEKNQLKMNKSLYGFTYVKLKKNQTVTLQDTKVSIKDGYFVTANQSKKINKTMKNTSTKYINGKIVPKVIKVVDGVLYYEGKKLTGSMSHKCVKNKELILHFHEGKVIDVQETYY
ncbi:hypothetical protein ACIQ4I_01605 [Rummeliibacillus sp. NPDC094406]|uniref:hypothetical protein n=1 Tax=Rummeliibacillus sp. NPDC094406 TaxID=3364511 RepID=UPI0038268FC2